MKLRNAVFVAALAAAGPVITAAPAEAVSACVSADVHLLGVDKSTGLVCLPYPFTVQCEAGGTSWGTVFDIDLYACVPRV